MAWTGSPDCPAAPPAGRSALPRPVLLAANIAGLALALVAVATVGRALIAFMLDAGLPPPAF